MIIYLASNLKKNEILDQLETAENIGLFNQIDENDLSSQADGITKCCKNLGVILYPELKDLGVELVQIFRIKDSDLYCGVCIGNDRVVLGTVSDYLQMVDKQTGTVINTTKFEGHACR